MILETAALSCSARQVGSDTHIELSPVIKLQWAPSTVYISDSTDQSSQQMFRR